MTDVEMTALAKGDPDASEMTAEMLAGCEPDFRLERSRAKRAAAARALTKQARAEAKALREREETGG